VVSLLQPAYLLAIFSLKEDTEVQLSNGGGTKQAINELSNGSLCSKKSSLLDGLMQYVERSNEFIDRFAHTRSVIIFQEFYYLM
jgi:nuclear pore complex protein Nup188